MLGVIIPNLLGILIIHNESYQAIIVKWNLRMEYYTLWNIDSIVLKCSSRYWIIYPSNFGFLTNWRIIPIVQKLVGHLVILVMTGLVTHFLASYSLMWWFVSSFHNDIIMHLLNLKKHKTLMTLPLKSNWKVWHLYKLTSAIQ